MTPAQLIALLDEMCIIALASVKKSRNGQVFYTVSRDEIREADYLLSGKFKLEDDEARDAYHAHLDT